MRLIRKTFIKILVSKIYKCHNKKKICKIKAENNIIGKGL